MPRVFGGGVGCLVSHDLSSIARRFLLAHVAQAMAPLDLLRPVSTCGFPHVGQFRSVNSSGYQTCMFPHTVPVDIIDIPVFFYFTAMNQNMHQRHNNTTFILITTVSTGPCYVLQTRHESECACVRMGGWQMKLIPSGDLWRLFDWCMRRRFQQALGIQTMADPNHIWCVHSVARRMRMCGADQSDYAIINGDDAMLPVLCNMSG